MEGNGRFKFHCEKCGLWYRSEIKLIVHQENCLREADPNRCQHCGTLFDNTYKVYDHVLYAHFKIYQFQCENCDKIFAERWSLQYHVKNNVCGNDAKGKIAKAKPNPVLKLTREDLSNLPLGKH